MSNEKFIFKIAEFFSINMNDKEEFNNLNRIITPIEIRWEVFNSEGYITYQAPNGKVALEIVRDETPDIVLLDMKIPGMDGLEILKQIKLMKPHMNVIMMTAYGELDMIKVLRRTDYTLCTLWRVSSLRSVGIRSTYEGVTDLLYYARDRCQALVYFSTNNCGIIIRVQDVGYI